MDIKLQLHICYKEGYMLLWRAKKPGGCDLDRSGKVALKKWGFSWELKHEQELRRWRWKGKTFQRGQFIARSYDGWSKESYYIIARAMRMVGNIMKELLGWLQ